MSDSKDILSTALKSTGNLYLPCDLFSRPEVTEIIGHYGVEGVVYYIHISLVLTQGCGVISKAAAMGAGLTVGKTGDQWRSILALLIKIGLMRYEGDNLISDTIRADQIKANAKQQTWRERKQKQRLSEGNRESPDPVNHTNGIELHEDDIPF